MAYNAFRRRERRPKFTKAELNALFNGLLKRKKIIKSANSGGKQSEIASERAWEEVIDEVNAVSSHVRTVTECKRKVIYFKTDLKKKCAVVANVCDEDENVEADDEFSFVERKALMWYEDIGQNSLDLNLDIKIENLENEGIDDPENYIVVGPIKDEQDEDELDMMAEEEDSDSSASHRDQVIKAENTESDSNYRDHHSLSESQLSTFKVFPVSRPVPSSYYQGDSLSNKRLSSSRDSPTDYDHQPLAKIQRSPLGRVSSEPSPNGKLMEELLQEIRELRAQLKDFKKPVVKCEKTTQTLEAMTYDTGSQTEFS